MLLPFSIEDSPPAAVAVATAPAHLFLLRRHINCMLQSGFLKTIKKFSQGHHLSVCLIREQWNIYFDSLSDQML